MKVTKYTTETGSIYKVWDDGLWTKNHDMVHGLMIYKAITNQQFENAKSVKELFDIAIDKPPVVGERLYIASTSTWWISTTIVMIEVYYDL